MASSLELELHLSALREKKHMMGHGCRRYNHEHSSLAIRRVFLFSGAEVRFSTALCG
jgi:hypothetical protein